MKIKLLKVPYCDSSVNSDTDRKKYPFVPLGLPILKSVLQEDGFKAEQDDLNVKIFKQNMVKDSSINLNLFNDRKRIDKFVKARSDPILEHESLKIINLTKHRGFDLFGLSLEEAHNPSAFGIVACLSKFIKEQYSVPIIGGGKIPYEVVHKLLAKGIIDYWVVEGSSYNVQYSFLELCRRFEDGKPVKDALVMYMSEGKIKITNKSVEEDRFILPDFEGLPLDLYSRDKELVINGETVIDNILTLPYFFVRGCPNKCAFCSNSTLDYWKTQNPDLVAEDLKYLSKEHKTKFFYFLNSSINPTKEYAALIAKSFIEKDLDIIFTDCANFKNMDADILINLKKAGAARLIYGLETASPELLNYINKGIAVKTAQDILKKTYESGIWGEIELIAGLPYETEEDVKKTINFVEHNKKYIQNVNLFKFWRDGKLLKEPEKFGLKPVSEKKERMCLPGNKRSFDETDGLKWSKKLRQTKKSFHQLMEMHRSNSIDSMPNFTLEESLFVMHVVNFMVD